LKAPSVVDCAPDRQSITTALDLVETEGFRTLLASRKNPYDPYEDGETARRVVDVLTSVDLDGVVKKHFFDLPESGR